MRILAGDIGGTKSELALFERDGSGAWEERTTARFPSADHAGVPALVRALLGDRAAPIDAAGFAVAGPVHDGACRITNLGWQLDARELSAALGAPVALMNDFAASALGILEPLGTDEVAVLQWGEVDPNGPVAFIGAGTGLGHAVAVVTDGGLHVLPGEGGHTDFAPRSDEEIALWRFLREKHGAPVSIERAVSGPGIVSLWEFAVAQGVESQPAALRAEMTTEDPAAVVSRHALDGSDPACGEALAMFLSLFGSEAGNFALKVLPTRGLYVTGGIAPRILDRLRGGEFMRAFLAKDRMQETLSRIRVLVALNTRLGLLGARALAVRALSSQAKAHAART